MAGSTGEREESAGNGQVRDSNQNGTEREKARSPSNTLTLWIEFVDFCL